MGSSRSDSSFISVSSLGSFSSTNTVSSTPEIKSIIEQLPPELLYIIFDYLPVRTLHYTLRLVSKRFALLLSNDRYFKTRFNKKYLGNGFQCPLLKYYHLNGEDNQDIREPWRSGQEVSWTDIAVRSDVRDHRYGEAEFQVTSSTYAFPHTATVDAVQLINDGRLCVSGGRDKILCLRDVTDGTVIHYEPDAHNGWIWDINDYAQNTILTCGWDGTIKHWVIRSNIEIIQQFYMQNANALCITSEPGIVSAGLNNGRIVLLDPRVVSTKQMLIAKLHRGPIMGIYKLNNQLISVGEDRNMTVFDIRKQQTLFQKTVNVLDSAYPRSIGAYRDLLYIGDSQGYINILDTNAEYTSVLCSRFGENRAINALFPNLEGLIVGTSDVGLRFVVPTTPVRVVAEYDLGGEVTSIDFKKGIIVAGCSNSAGSVNIFNGLD